MIRYGEFCAGIGGFRLGISQSDVDAICVYKNEIDDRCELTYEENFGEKFDSKNIFEIDASKLPDMDMICAGFPCQPFSIAGKQKGLLDERGTIIYKLLEIIKAKEPKVVFFENVANLKKHNGGKTFGYIISEIEKMGYLVYSQVLDSYDFGVPQKRPRVYIVAFNRSKVGDVFFDFPEGVSERKTIRDILESRDNSIPISEKWQEYVDLYTGIKTADEMSFELPKTRKKLERVASDCDLKDCVFQIRSSGIRAYSLDGPFPTFAVSNSGGGAMIPVLSKERRHINLTEIRRMMGFPEEYTFASVSRTDGIKQLANAVCPPVIENIFDEIGALVE